MRIARVAGIAAPALAWVLGAAPRAAQACSVCQGGTSDNRVEFILTTALLTFLPLVLIGSGVWYLRRRYLRLARQAPAALPDIAPAAHPSGALER